VRKRRWRSRARPPPPDVAHGRVCSCPAAGGKV
jgi:hypothetical protein